jgi:hypothetical protein
MLGSDDVIGFMGQAQHIIRQAAILTAMVGSFGDETP